MTHHTCTTETILQGDNAGENTCYQTKRKQALQS